MNKPYFSAGTGRELAQTVHLEQIWVYDITSIRVRHGFAYLAVIMDVPTGRIRGLTFGSPHLGRNLDHTLILVALQRALVRFPAPEIHHSDQGV